MKVFISYLSEMKIACSITFLYSSTFYSFFLPFFVLEIFKFKYDKVLVRQSLSHILANVASVFIRDWKLKFCLRNSIIFSPFLGQNVGRGWVKNDKNGYFHTSHHTPNSVFPKKEVLKSLVPRTLSHGENTTTNPCEIANVFNNYFASVAETAKQNINYSHKHFSEYLKHQCNNSIFIQPTDSEEIANIISSLSINKACGPFSIWNKSSKTGYFYTTCRFI